MAFLLGKASPTEQNNAKKDAADAPAQNRMANAVPKDPSNYAAWEPKDISEYFSAKGYSEYSELWISHKITGERAVMLTPENLKEMGVERIGDRIGIQKELQQLKFVARRVQRNTVLAEHQQAYDGSWCQENVQKYCCFMCCPIEPDTYTLTNNELKIRSYEVSRICGARCTCLGGVWATDTMRLDRLNDVDTSVSLRGCALCAEKKCTILLAMQAGNSAEEETSRVTQKYMLLEAEQGKHFAERIREAADEYRTSLSSDVL